MKRYCHWLRLVQIYFGKLGAWLLGKSTSVNGIAIHDMFFSVPSEKRLRNLQIVTDAILRIVGSADAKAVLGLRNIRIVYIDRGSGFRSYKGHRILFVNPNTDAETFYENMAFVVKQFVDVDFYNEKF